MRFIVFLALALIVVATGIWWVLTQNRQTEENEQTPAAQEQPDSSNPLDIDTLVVDLEQVGDSGESGTAVMKRGEENITVTLELTGIPEGSVRYAAIYAGSCGSLQEEVSPLTDVVEGTSETALSKSPIEMRDIRIESGMAVAVRVSATGQDIVACGNVTIPVL